MDMLEDFLPSPEVCARLREGPLGAYVDGFASLLSECGYSCFAVRHKVRAVGRLGRWMEAGGLAADELDFDTLAEFLACRNCRRDTRSGVRAGLRLLVRYMAESVGDGSGARRSAPEDSELGRIESEFATHLSDERGLAPATLLNYLPEVRRFLADRFASGPADMDSIIASDVTSFMLRSASVMGLRRTQLVATALRVFFRFLLLRGFVSVDLTGSVPTVAQRRLSTVPKSLAPDQVELLLAACERRTGGGRRDYAILMILARLGLRAGEVVSLVLGDIDWDRGEVRISGKGGRRNLLPVPADVGEALAEYLRHGRPPCDSRRVFIRARAPFRGFSSSVAIDDVVRRALKRAGLDPPRKGAHLLRHSLAVRMLGNDASLAEIGEVLRHSVVGTTEIYAKVDVDALGALAQPWPGGDA